MRLPTVLSACGVAAGLVALTLAADQPPKAEKTASPRGGDLLERLQTPADLGRPGDNMPLRDALELLGDRYGLDIRIDSLAFDQDKGVKSIEDAPVRPPRGTAVRPQDALRELLAQVGGAFLVRGDHVEATTFERMVAEVYGSPLDDRNTKRVGQPLVNVAFDHRPLERALADLSAQTGRTIALDPRVGDRDKLSVTIRLLNAPLDTAVRLLTEANGLKAAQLDNVFLVTTREHAAELQAEQEQLSRKARLEAREEAEARLQAARAAAGEPMPGKSRQ